MCWHRWIPVIPKGCKVSNPHVVMHKEMIYCNTVIDTAIKLSQPDCDLNDVEKEGQWRTRSRVKFDVCPDGNSKIFDSFNRSIEVKPLQVVNIRCPCCTGEMSTVDALLTDSNFQSSYAVLPNGRQLRIPNVTEGLDDYLCQPLDQPLPKLRISKTKIHEVEDSLFDTDSIQDEHNSETCLQCRRIKSQSGNPKVWQMTPKGVVSGMMTPVYRGTDGENEADYWGEEDEYEIADLGCVGLRFPVTKTATPPYVNPVHGLIQKLDDEWSDIHQGA
ncbi:hypothetical protein N7481_008245 [Penicillium waksmanii]|uniref:uncharacterized protein n=1 Tax=Penicillium waksmanii TaxID=69791 RepID=UPI0025467A99|nr:uncharacterized protein N7481_008245 [Penicillium waksmanii]KAJ5980947.1 hypothetical protein N7481_008245 [Penicillium waksmanii]